MRKYNPATELHASHPPQARHEVADYWQKERRHEYKNLLPVGIQEFEASGDRHNNALSQTRLWPDDQ